LHQALSELRRSGSEAAYRIANPPRFSAPIGIMELLGVDALLAFERRFHAGGDDA
jgi:hypothetical protein